MSFYAFILRQSFLILGVFMLFIDIAGASSSELKNTLENEVNKKQQTLFILGDSLSAGYGIKVEQNWVYLLAKKLQSTHPHIQVVNASISGDTTANGLQRLKQAREVLSIDYLIIELGANDGLRGFPISQAKSNIAKMIEIGQADGAKVLLLGMQIPPNYGKKYTRAFAHMYPQLKAQHKVLLVPFMLSAVAGKTEYQQADGLHPNAKAQALILNTLWPQIEELLKP